MSDITYPSELFTQVSTSFGGLHFTQEAADRLKRIIDHQTVVSAPNGRSVLRMQWRSEPWDPFEFPPDAWAV